MADIDLGALYVSVLPETSKVAPAMEKAGQDAKTAFERGSSGIGDKLSTSLKDAGKHGETAGTDMGQKLSSGLHSNLVAGGQQALHGLAQTLVGGAQGIGSQMGGGIASSLVSTMSKGAGTVVTAFGQMGSAGGAMGGGVAAGAAVGTAGIAALAAAAIATTVELYKIGEAFDKVSDDMLIQTGAVGDRLAELNAGVANVMTSTSASPGAIGNITGQLNQLLGMTGSTLERTTLQVADYNEMNKQAPLNISAFSDVLKQFNIDNIDAAGALNTLKNAAQQSGIPLNELTATLRSSGEVAQEFGLTFDGTVQMMVEFKKQGLDGATSATALRQALTNLAAAQRGGSDAAIAFRDSLNITATDSPVTMLQKAITAIKELDAAGRSAEAAELGKKIFGGRSWVQILGLIKEGKFDIAELNKGLQGIQTTIGQDRQATEDWQDSLGELGNTFKSALKPVSDTLFGVIDMDIKAVDMALRKVFGMPRKVDAELNKESVAEIKADLDQFFANYAAALGLPNPFGPDKDTSGNGWGGTPATLVTPSGTRAGTWYPGAASGTTPNYTPGLPGLSPLSAGGNPLGAMTGPTGPAGQSYSQPRGLPPITSGGANAGMQTGTIGVKNRIAADLGVTIGGGYRQPDGYDEHSGGNAFDVMVGSKAEGDKVLADALQQPGVDYAIWWQRTWHPDGSNGGLMPDRGSPTANHMDHVHVHVASSGYPAGGSPSDTGKPRGANAAPLPSGPAGSPGQGFPLGGYYNGPPLSPSGAGPAGGWAGPGGGGAANPPQAGWYGPNAPPPPYSAYPDATYTPMAPYPGEAAAGGITEDQWNSRQRAIQSATDAATDAQYRVKQAEDRLAALYAETDDAGKRKATDQEIGEAQHSLSVAQREAANAQDGLTEATRKAGEPLKAKADKRSSGGGDGAGGLLKGLLSDLGLDGDLFSDPTEWGAFKLAMGGLNFGMHYAKNMSSIGGVPIPGMGDGTILADGGAAAGGGGGMPGMGMLNGLLPGVDIAGAATPTMTAADAVSQYPTVAAMQPGQPGAPATPGRLPGPPGGVVINGNVTTQDPQQLAPVMQEHMNAQSRYTFQGPGPGN